MARQAYYFPILLIAIIFLAFSHIACARVYEENQNEVVPKVDIPDASHGTTHVVPHPADGSGAAHPDLINCFTCPLIFGFCCGFFCCSAEQYAEYVKIQGLPHN